MTRPAAWKVLTVGAAFTGLSLVGAGPAVATAAPAPQAGPAITTTVDAPLANANCSNRGGLTTHCQTNGSSQLHTTPMPRAGGIYGPFFNQNRGLGWRSRHRAIARRAWRYTNNGSGHLTPARAGRAAGPLS